jgi:hypothetical protein
MEAEGQYVCTQCGKSYPEAGNCPVHPEEPLLDAGNREICFFLMQLDDQKRNKVYTLWITLMLCVGVVAGGLVCYLVDLALDFDLGYGKSLIIGGLAGGSLGTGLAARLFKPRYRQFTQKLEQI